MSRLVNDQASEIGYNAKAVPDGCSPLCSALTMIYLNQKAYDVNK